MGRLSELSVSSDVSLQLSPEEDKKVHAFLDAVDISYRSSPPLAEVLRDDLGEDAAVHPAHHYARAFLRTHDWCVKDATAASLASLKSRRDGHMDANPFPAVIPIQGWIEDDVAQDIFPDSAPRESSCLDRLHVGIQQRLKISLRHWDVNGLPVMYMQLSAAENISMSAEVSRFAEVGHSPKGVLFDYVAHALHVAEALAMYQLRLARVTPEPPSGAIPTVSIVLDVHALRFSDCFSWGCSTLMQVLSQLMDYYPFLVSKLLVVNCASSVVTKLLRSRMALSSRKRTCFLARKDSEVALLTFIDSAYLPADFGGAGPSSSEVSKEVSILVHDIHDVDTEEFSLEMSDRVFKIFGVATGEEVVWDYATYKNRFKLRFSTYFIPKEVSDQARLDGPTDKGLAKFLHERQSSTKGSGTMTAPACGTVVLIWKNMSLYGGIRLQLRVHKD